MENMVPPDARHPSPADHDGVVEFTVLGLVTRASPESCRTAAEASNLLQY